MIPLKYITIISSSILVVVTSFEVKIGLYSHINQTPNSIAREEWIDKLPSENSVLKHAYETVDKMDHRSQIYDKVIDYYYTYFNEWEMRVKDEVKERFVNWCDIAKHSEIEAMKEDLARQLTENVDKYIESTLKTRIFSRNLTEFHSLFSNEEQLKFFKDYLHAYNYTQEYKYPEYRPQYTPVNISNIYGDE